MNIHSSDSRRACVERQYARLKLRGLAPELAQVLGQLHQNLPLSQHGRTNLADLMSGEAVCVITGQQAGLFGGPLYSYYKTLSAIRTAQTLQQETGIRVVPLFWIQSEDHDFDEIAHCRLISASGEFLSIDQPLTNIADDRVSVEYQTLSFAIADNLELLRKEFERFPDAAPMLEMFNRAYRPGKSLTQAFVDLWAELFADEGLLFFNPRRAELGPLVQPLYEKALVDYRDIAGMLRQRSSELQASGDEEQVFVREDSPLFFFHPQGANGPRYRLRHEGQTFSLIGSESEQRYTSAELLSTLASDPLSFSTSALLRPILQDSLFPVAAYIGGPAEMRYWRQIEPLHEKFDLTEPLLIPRAGFTIVEPKVKRWLNELDFSPEDLQESDETLQRKVATQKQLDNEINPDFIEREIHTHVAAVYHALETGVRRVDQTLLTPLRKNREQHLEQLNRLLERYRKALILQDNVSAERIDKLRRIFFPNGIAQERYFSLPQYLLRYGSSFREHLAAAWTAYDDAMKTVEL